MNTLLNPAPADRHAASLARALVHQLYEAAELEHNLMCTYLYAAFSLRSGAEEGLSAAEADATARWRRAILKVAIEEMGHLTAVWNITAALGGSPRFGRLNFPLDPGRAAGQRGRAGWRRSAKRCCSTSSISSARPAPPSPTARASRRSSCSRAAIARPRVTPMPIDYETVGAFYETLSKNLAAFVARVGEKEAFCGDRNLQISRKEIDFQGCDPVICSITALKAFDAIVSQGEGASKENADSHYRASSRSAKSCARCSAANPDFQPALSRGRESGAAPAGARRARACGSRTKRPRPPSISRTRAYMLMLRLISHSYLLPRPHPAKALCVDLGARADARHDAARRARGAPAGGPVESRIATAACRSPRCATPRRCRRASAPESSFVERLRELDGRRAGARPRNGDARVAQALRILSDLAAARRAQLREHRAAIRRRAERWQRRAGARRRAASRRPAGAPAARR